MKACPREEIWLSGYLATESHRAYIPMPKGRGFTPIFLVNNYYPFLYLSCNILYLVLHICQYSDYTILDKSIKVDIIRYELSFNFLLRLKRDKFADVLKSQY